MREADGKERKEFQTTQFLTTTMALAEHFRKEHYFSSFTASADRRKFGTNSSISSPVSSCPFGGFVVVYVIVGVVVVVVVVFEIDVTVVVADWDQIWNQKTKKSDICKFFVILLLLKHFLGYS